MINWIAQNISTIIISIVLLAIVSTILFVMVKNKKKGKSSCGCACTNCPMSGKCHPKNC
ncbi:MAG: FeoB-associated Cys-rich membrane protein [Oscillospiraceae bacterium]